jgi:hypothetical protein
MDRDGIELGTEPWRLRPVVKTQKWLHEMTLSKWRIAYGRVVKTPQERGHWYRQQTAAPSAGHWRMGSDPPAVSRPHAPLSRSQ